MNKYQEALDRISFNFGLDCLDNNVSEDERIKLATDISLMQELVDRATPKKPIKDQPSKIRYVRTYVCPVCGNSISGISCFCYHCGQALDWSE